MMYVVPYASVRVDMLHERKGYDVLSQQYAKKLGIHPPIAVQLPVTTTMETLFKVADQYVKEASEKEVAEKEDT